MSEAAQVGLPGVEAQRGAVDSDACFTPAWIINGVVRVMGGIDTDCCWHEDCHVRPLLAKFDGREHGDGLAGTWLGRLWFQPPYSDPLPWAKRVPGHLAEGFPAMGLVKHDPSTKWWKVLMGALDRKPIIGMFSERVRFEGEFAGGGTPNMTVTAISWRNDIETLKAEFPTVDWRGPL